jgi:hypothetical protein
MDGMCDTFERERAVALCDTEEACAGITTSECVYDWQYDEFENYTSGSTPGRERVCYQLRVDRVLRPSGANETSWRKQSCRVPAPSSEVEGGAEGGTGVNQGVGGGDAQQRAETVLILSPIRDRDGPGARGTMGNDLDRFFGLMRQLTYPRALTSVAILEGDSADETFERTRAHLTEMRKLGYRRLLLVKKDFEPETEQEEMELEKDEMEGNTRHDEGVQAPRRAKLARIRNTLLTTALRDEDWVLWLDSDLWRYGPNLIEALMSSGRSITVPNCVFEQFGGRPYDLNNWQETEVSEVLKSIKPEGEPLFEGGDEDNGRLNLAQVDGDLVPLDGIGGAVILIRADVHRDGLVFPSFVFEHQLETEGLARMATAMGHTPFALNSVEVIHK